MRVVMGGTGDRATKQPWDVRLLDRWAREAREAANDPKRFVRPSVREQIGFAAFLRGDWLPLPVVFLVGLGGILGLEVAIEGSVRFGPAIAGAAGGTIGTLASRRRRAKRREHNGGCGQAGDPHSRLHA
jgi:hypothetical protein